jgi:hypothetical protein
LPLLIDSVLTSDNVTILTREMEIARSSRLRDLGFLPRAKRQKIYARILNERNVVMTPGRMKEELERNGLTFGFVGQDMAPMRMMPFILSGGRGQYGWNKNFKVITHLYFCKESPPFCVLQGDWRESFEKEDKCSKSDKRRRSKIISEEVNFENFDFKSLSVLDDHADPRELPENVLVRKMSDLDILVAATEWRAPASVSVCQKCDCNEVCENCKTWKEVCGYRVRK